MRILYAFIIYLAMALTLGALISAGLFALIQYSFLFDIGLGEYNFEKIAGRCLLLTLLIGLWVFLKILHLNHWSKLGYTVPKPEFARLVGRGFFFGTLTMAVVAIALVVLDVRYWQFEGGLGFILGLVIKSTLQGLLIAFIEETLFRGALIQFGASHKPKESLHLVVLGAAFIYAILHFIKSETHIGPDELVWSSGFSYLSGAFYKLSEASFLGSFLTLLMVGLFLGYIRVYTGSIALGIGIHAGWIMIIQVCSGLTETNRWTDLYFLVGNYDRVTGYLAASWLAMVGLFLLRRHSIQRLTGPYSPKPPG